MLPEVNLRFLQLFEVIYIIVSTRCKKPKNMLAQMQNLQKFYV